MTRKIVSVLMLVFFISLAAVQAQADSWTWADEVVWESGDPLSTDPTRLDPENALDEPDSIFLSLGIGGLAIFAFGTDFDTQAAVVEITWGNRSGHVETANVYVAGSGFKSTFDSLATATPGSADIKNNMSTFTQVGSIINSSATSLVSLSGVSGPFTYLLIEDTSVIPTGATRDGFDIDAVGVQHATPEPASMLLFGSGMAGLAWYRRRRNKRG
jgi:hypothetical protein